MVLEAGETYYLHVEFPGGGYHLLITRGGLDASPVPGFSAPGDSCDASFVVDEFPFSAKRNLEFAKNDHQQHPSSCPGLGLPFATEGRDHVYSFTPPADGFYQFDTSNMNSSMLFISDTCGACTAGAGGYQDSTLRKHLKGGIEYFIVVEGATYEGAPNYEFAISECTPDCENKECGTDGCGGSCGEGVCEPVAQQCRGPGCIGYCGTMAPEGCFCDALCHDAGDCCENVCDACGSLEECTPE